jgi:outer membrane lipoprotein LolB
MFPLAIHILTIIILVYMLLRANPLKKSYLRWLLASVLSFALIGCATQQTPLSAIDEVAHQQVLAKLENWQIKGKMGLKSPDKKQSANFRWQQKTDQYQLNLTSIIGTSLLSVRGNKGSVRLTIDDNSYQDTDPSQLIKRMTGWQIPVKGIQSWVKGQYNPADKVRLSEQGWLTQMQPACDNCKNWLINYAHYKLVDNVWLPHQIKLHNNTNNSQLIIRVNTWILD